MPSDTTEENQPLTHRQIQTVFAGLMLGMLLSALDQTIVSTALPTIVGELGGLQHLSWIVTAYMLASTVSAPIYGKLSDLYGRRVMFQTAIVIFLIGSVLAGLSRTMFELAVFRGVQGAGGGGLMVLSQAIIGDIVSPRQRGRYQGYIGSMFALSSVVGPLLGGFFVDQLTWRWAFYVNLPLGALALVVTQRALKLTHKRREHRIDWAGAAMLSTAITTFLLATVWGGDTYAWDSPMIVGLAVASLVSFVIFLLVERRAEEPILPLVLFEERVFAVGTFLAFVTAMAMFAAIIFMPLYLQVAVGVSATDSGLLLMPLMAGMLTTSIGSGRLITRWGRYKVFPVVGTATVGVGYVLLSTMGAGTPVAVVSVFTAIVGLGLGMVNQVVVLAIQNAVPGEHLGAATSAAQFFRSIGGTVGVTVFGAVLNARLDVTLERLLPRGMELPGDVRALLRAPAEMAALPEPVFHALQQAVSQSVTFVFAMVIPVALVAFIAALMLHELPLRDRPTTELAPLE